MDERYELISDGLPVGFDRSLHHDEFMGSLFQALSGHVDVVPGHVVVDPAATCLVADTFFVWPATLARKFEPRKDMITHIPGVTAIEPHELMSYLQETDTTKVVHCILFKAFEEARGADYVLCNTVEELEPSTIVALRAEKPFYAVGPIFPAGFAHSAVATSMRAESNCSHLLDAQPLGSMLYISFGSYAHVTKQELHEIAGGVLASGARFLWVMRPDIVSSDDPDPLPEGFAAASAGRGLVVSWCCLMTHKYRGSIVVLSISKSVEPNEEQKKMISGFQQGILYKH
uniref:Cyanohydrin beta-glucosyltransferase n=1 Tax=Aegilops tauschii TaxID=37682 RepID=M8BMC5_AEGTA